MKKVAIYGIDEVARGVIQQYKAMELIGLVEVVAILDNDSRYSGAFFESTPILAPEMVASLDYDLIIVVPIFFDVISKQLVEAGASQKHIVPFFADHSRFFATTDRAWDDNEIGRYSYFKPGGVLRNTTIGAFCHIGHNVRIGQGGGHRLDLVGSYPLSYRVTNTIKDSNNDPTGGEPIQKTIIGNDVYIGSEVTIMSGVTVHDGAVLGYQSLVTQDVPPYAVIFGSPAKIHRSRFNDEQISKLLEFKWWSKPLEEIQKYASLIEGPVENLITSEWYKSYTSSG